MTVINVGTPVHGRDAPSGESISVLLVEDDEGDAFLVTEMLADVPEEISVIRAHSLADAVPHVAGSDCVLLDLGLPDALGLDALQRLAVHADRVPIVVLTGDRNERLGIAAVAAGAQDYLIKGEVTGKLLARTIRYAVQRQRLDETESALLEERLHAEENVRLERGLLPRPVIRTSDVEVTTRYRPGGQRLLLGGDFFDAVQDRAGALHLIIGDVAGHGPDQAALGVALRIAWRTLILADRPTDEIFTTLHQILVHERHEDEVLATVYAVSVAPDRRSAVVCAAGHPDALLRSDKAHWKPLPRSAGPALGLLDTIRWAPATCELPAPPWQILLYTDGAIEGRTQGGHDRLGTQGLLDVLAADGPKTPIAPGALLDGVISTVTGMNGGPLTDDVALLLLSVWPSA